MFVIVCPYFYIFIIWCTSILYCLSVIRGFNGKSISAFLEHACETNRIEQCMLTRQSPDRRKRCIVEEAEIAIADLYDADRVDGLYPSNPPNGYPSQNMWVSNDGFWRNILVKQLDFPVAKVNRPGMIKGITDEKLKACTRFMDGEFFRTYNYSLYQSIAGTSLLSK